MFSDNENIQEENNSKLINPIFMPKNRKRLNNFKFILKPF